MRLEDGRPCFEETDHGLLWIISVAGATVFVLCSKITLGKSFQTQIRNSHAVGWSLTASAKKLIL